MTKAVGAAGSAVDLRNDRVFGGVSTRVAPPSRASHLTWDGWRATGHDREGTVVVGAAISRGRYAAGIRPST